MDSLLRSLILSTVLIPNLFVVNAVAADMAPPELSRPFQPASPGIPQRRLSGGTR
ncbi:hypothetical protein IQ260_13720 [Leptolyngbya cf. ectocarpi LEGE 11479]|uniref:Uncharacterized protein n=1 Tax=Leptolyngbya cf. ectocarpi LEGE 11479 TaxID=1828722 RepID=A0A928ZUJ4_LEPEC|nr:hypothetical protein [Leptolyngbya ectocarpi]MBE9067713.1 hypothetical protein [Leptolyngbya cf. ectocarpi LEGE 11479]